MDEEYDAVVLGTGLKECILSGLLSVEGYKVLHMDRNDYYGGASASLNLKQMYERFRSGSTPPDSLGSSRDYNIDLVPKFIMANGNLVKVLIHTDVTKYLEFKAVEGSFVLNQSRVEKVPATDWEALRSPLMGLFEKRRAAKFLAYCQQYNPEDSTTWRTWDLNKMTMYELYQQFGVSPMTIDFLGHAVALHRDDQYMVQPAKSTVMKVCI
jgi:Rab GDP dissociation inhibitor